MKKLTIIITLLVLSFILASCSENNEMSNNMGNEMGEMNENISTSDKIKSEIVITKNNINLGIIPMDEGKVNIPFEITNNGTEDIILGKSETSCMCTEGFITDINGGNKSGRIKMAGHAAILDLKRIIKPGEKLYLIGVYDPNAHGPDATGPIARDIYISTNSSTTPRLDFKFFGEVVKTKVNKVVEKIEKKTQKINKDIFSFDNISYDFGKIKQSGGKVSHDFKFTYNGKEKIKVTGVPTSCACTSASIDKTELNPGDEGILTVKFNPNLHQEPEGVFFKTVNILTSPKLEKIPEVKIWTEIDLDLGAKAFELKGPHKD